MCSPQVLEVFKVDPDTQQSKYPVPSQILMIYYVLLYHDCYLNNLRALSEFQLYIILLAQMWQCYQCIAGDFQERTLCNFNGLVAMRKSFPCELWGHGIAIWGVAYSDTCGSCIQSSDRDFCCSQSTFNPIRQTMISTIVLISLVPSLHCYAHRFVYQN